jgi:uncharacterized membrane protein YidH (DUF202 family)
MINGCQLSLSHAPHPDNIEWFNLGQTKWEKVRQSVGSYVLIGVGLLIVGAGVWVFNYEEYTVKKKSLFSTRAVKTSVSFWELLLVPAVIYISNYLLRKFSMFLNAKEKHETTSTR